MAVKTAVQRVGANGVHAAVMQHFVSGELLRPGPKFEDMARKVWQHMVRVAPIAREFTKATRVDPDHAFTAALLHDVGKLVFLNHIGRKRKELRREIQVSPGFVSVALTLLHEPLGEQAALSWGLPGAFAEAIGGHHREYPGEEADLLSEVVYLAEALDIMRLRGDTPNLDSLWTAGRLTGPREMVEGWLANEG
jgi:putative nucleotidyltransferase with HDIG domain